MKLEFEKITTHERLPISILSLYLLAFPADERRPCRSLFQLIDGAEKGFDFRIIRWNGELAGFMTTWNGDGFLYVEHFATLEHLRGSGIGGRALDRLRIETGLPLLLEVELPESGELACRRIEFYRRHGLVPHPSYRYMQPAYASGLSPLPMMLMTSCGDVDLDVARDFLYSRVYGVSEPPSAGCTCEI